MYSKEPVQQVIGFLAWKMHARVAYHFNSNTNITILQITVNIYYCYISSNETSY